jgi:hypothetical protein
MVNSKKPSRKRETQNYPYRIYRDYYFGVCKVVGRDPPLYVIVENKHGHRQRVLEIFLEMKVR